MKLSDGFSKPGPSVLIFLFFMAGAAMQTFAMRNSQLSVTYIVVLGVEAAMAFVFGMMFFKEVHSLPKILGTSLVLVGIVLLRTADV